MQKIEAHVQISGATRMSRSCVYSIFCMLYIFGSSFNFCPIPDFFGLNRGCLTSSCRLHKRRALNSSSGVCYCT